MRDGKVVLNHNEPSPTPSPTPKRTFDSRVQTRPPVMKSPFCKFCYNRRRPASEFKSHFTKSGPEFGAKVVCPLLLAQQCARCGEIGHTPKMCKSEHYLRTDSNDSINTPGEYYTFSICSLENPDSWKHPIPPALQARHTQWVEENVKTSRIWIMMSGDHKQYTDDYFICYGGPHWVPFHVKPKTEHEHHVESRYNWMRRVIPTQSQKNANPHYYYSESSLSSGEGSVASPKTKTTTCQPDVSRTEMSKIISKYCVPKTDASSK